MAQAMRHNGSAGGHHRPREAADCTSKGGIGRNRTHWVRLQIAPIWCNLVAHHFRAQLGIVLMQACQEFSIGRCHRCGSAFDAQLDVPAKLRMVHAG